MNKFFGNKGLAAQALIKVGQVAFEHKDELLYVGNDGKWGFCVEEAEAFEAGDFKTVAKCNGFADLLNPTIPQMDGKLTVHLLDGKAAKQDHFEAEHKAHRAEKEVALVTKTSHTGYKIEKDRPTQNGVTRRSPSSLSGQIWAILDAMESPTSKDLQAIADENLWKLTNVSCEFYKWRKFNA